MELPCDSAYETSRDVWGPKQGSLVTKLVESVDVSGLSVLDLGCGEGKNAAYLASLGANVHAIDGSDLALKRAMGLWKSSNIRWECADIRTYPQLLEVYDLVIMYGLLHWMNSAAEAEHVASWAKVATRKGGHNLICSFNSRLPYPHAEDGLSPLLMSHDEQLALYQDWDKTDVSDSDLVDSHGHIAEAHRHAMTRMIVQRPS